MKQFIVIACSVMICGAARCAERNDIDGFSLGSTDTNTAVGKIDDLYCRSGHNALQCIDESQNPTHGQTYYIDLDDRQQIIQVTRSTCVADLTTKQFIITKIMPAFDINSGAQLIDTQKENTFVFKDSVSAGDFTVALVTRQHCVSGNRRGIWYSEIISSNSK